MSCSAQLTVSVSVTLWLKAVDPEPVLPVIVRGKYLRVSRGCRLLRHPLHCRQPASASASSNPAASGRNAACHRPAPQILRRANAHAIAARTKASINKSLRPVESGGAGGTGPEGGALIEAAVVVTVTVTLVAELPSDAGLGETVQVASEGAPVQVKLTVPDNPPSPPTLKV